jgi:hypothetical protein
MDDIYSYAGMWIAVLAIIGIHGLVKLILLRRGEPASAPARSPQATLRESRAAEPAAQPEPQHLWARPGWKPPR